MSVPQPEAVRPLALRKEGADRLAIDWSDGHRSVYAWQHLRQNCPCAGCKEEKLQPPDPFRILTPVELAAKGPPLPVQLEPVGYYAYRIIWNDGHDAGLFTLDNLRSLCQCELCRSK
jgi:DUF971 family protein